MRLTELFVPEAVVTDFAPAPKEDLLAAIVGDLDAKGLVADRRLTADDVIARERIMSTCVGNGVAIPHAYTGGVAPRVVGVIRTHEPVEFGGPDGVPADVFFVVLGPRESRREHIRLLAKLSRLLNHDDFRAQMRDAADADALLTAFRRFGDR
jgi:mannitol/fructose-specific phosphotransferase system IIA component (Ntr-type)